MARKRADGTVEYYDASLDGFAAVTAEYVSLLEWHAELGKVMLDLNATVRWAGPKLGEQRRAAIVKELRGLQQKLAELT